MLWVHHEAKALRVHDRVTIPEITARHVIVDLLASGQVARMNAGWLATRPPGSRRPDTRFPSSAVALAQIGRLLSSSMVAVSSCLSRDESLLPCAIVVQPAALSRCSAGFHFTAPAKPKGTGFSDLAGC